MFHVPNKYRVRKGQAASSDDYGNNGAFFIKSLKLNRPLYVIASDGLGWEHVSVSLPDRCPHWDEMCFVKSLFWDPSDLVVQFHPPADLYVNNHPHTLHLWRKAGDNDWVPMPMKGMV